MAASRYVDDVPYDYAFIPELSPAWLDFAGLLWGLAPPERDDGFAWCDMGCGQGVTAVVLAATHGRGIFHGVDAMPMHVEHARRLAAGAGLDNVTFHAVDFGAAIGLDLPDFDYITAHGVYSWVDDRARADLLRFIDRRLKPGGRAYISYNALPGRTADLPFQQLMLQLADQSGGDSLERVAAAAAFARRMRDVNTAALVASPMAGALLPRRKPAARRASYLAHELLNPHWRPLSVLEVRRDMATIGLAPAGSATLIDNFDSYVLSQPAQRLLNQVDNPDLRDLVRDYFTNQSFRRDVFVRGGAILDDREQAKRLAETTFALAHPPGQVSYRMDTTAGQVGFDNPAARSAVRALARGPCALGALPGDQGDRLANVLALAASGQVWPVESGNADVSRFNRLAAERWGGPEALRVFALGCGTALQPPGAVLSTLHKGGAARGWRKHLAAYGASLT